TPAFTQVPAICSGGSFALPATSNNGISGTWSPDINNTATTTYTFTPTAGQCATTATMTVTVNNSTTPAFTQVPAICSGGTFTLPATSNNGISGTWSPAINNTSTTTYTFTPTAGQCATTATMTVTVNNNTTPAFTQVPAICSGGSFALPATSNNGISGTWSPAINNTATTTYTFTPTAGQCATTATMTVNVNTVNTSVSISGITITAAATNAGYQWIDCADNTLIGGAQSNSYTATANGSYAVIVTQNGCSDTSICTTIATVGLEEPGKEAPRVYPNPGPGIFVLVTPGQSAGAAYQVLDLSGKVLVNGKIAAEQTHIDLSAYLPGIYLIRLPESSGVLRIIKQ
ncbi:MAG: T9SS type A sorting domain-containing protein, partial [Flavobacteriales bacterium]